MSVNGLIGRKVGMTSIFDAQGAMLGVTVIEVGPNPVVALRTKDKDGYSAVALGFGQKRKTRVRKPQQGQADKSGLPAWPAVVREVELVGDGPKAGEVLKVGDVFTADTMVDVIGTSIGKGFAGVHKRHHFNLGPYTHGSKNYREQKSSGQNTFPARRWKGTRMSGHMGAVRRTVRNLRIVAVDAERNLLLVNGPVPGFDTGIVIVRKCVAKNVSKDAATKAKG